MGGVVLPLPPSRSLKPQEGQCWREGEKVGFTSDMGLVV